MLHSKDASGHGPSFQGGFHSSREQCSGGEWSPGAALAAAITWRLMSAREAGTRLSVGDATP